MPKFIELINQRGRAKTLKKSSYRVNTLNNKVYLSITVPASLAVTMGWKHKDKIIVSYNAVKPSQICLWKTMTGKGYSFLQSSGTDTGRIRFRWEDCQLPNILKTVPVAKEEIEDDCIIIDLI